MPHAEISFWVTPSKTLTVFDRIFVDDWEQVKQHGVDISRRALKEGGIPEEKISKELVSGKTNWTLVQ